MICLAMYKVYDSYGNLVRGGFSSYQDAEKWIFAKGGNPGYKIGKNSWCLSQWRIG